MSPNARKTALISVFAVMVLATLACLGGSGNNNAGNTGNTGDTGNTSGNNEGPDLAATQISLEATQAAIAAANSSDSGDSGDTGDSGDSGGDSADGTIDPASFNADESMYLTEFDPTGDWDNRWFHFSLPDDNDGFTVIMESDVLYVRVSDKKTGVYVMFDDLYMPRNDADVYIETFYDNVGSVRNNNISLVCRATEDGWYEFSASSNGLWWMYKYTEGDGYVQLVQGGLPNYNKNETAHKIGASCIGDELRFYYDGDLLKNGKFTDSSATFREGGVGVSVFADNLVDVEVEFDWFQVIKQ
jgi:hypothetical protein